MILIFIGILRTTEVPESPNLLNGIIKYLQNTTKETYLNNVGVARASASSSRDNAHLPDNIFGLTSDTFNGYWASQPRPNQWIQIDFLRNAALITDYILYAYSWDFLKEWEIYCSLDNVKWYMIDHQSMTEEPTLSSEKIAVRYHIEEPLICRYFKIQQKDKCWGGETDYFFMHKIEFFGVFYNSSSLLKMAKTCFYYRYFSYRFLSFAFISIII